MKKQFLTVAIIFIGVTAFGQTKIGANSGMIQSGQLLQLEKNGTTAGLKVAEVALTGSNDVTTIKLPATATAAQGTLIWNTATVAGGNAVSPGFYVWTGALWEKVTTGAGSNIYSADGTLTGTRTLNQSTFNLNFTSAASSGTSHFTVDGSTFNVDAVNNRIGINTTNPGNRLEINSGISAASGLRFTNLNSSSTPVTSGVIPLGVDAAGDVVPIKSFTSGQMLQRLVIIGSGNIGLVNGTSSGWNFASITPKSNFSTITVEIDADYSLSGIQDNESWIVELKVNNSQYFYKKQFWWNTLGGGTRSSVLFPLIYAFNNGDLGPKTIGLFVSKQTGPPASGINYTGGAVAIITETER